MSFCFVIEWSEEVVELCREYQNEGVVGIDLAGNESLDKIPQNSKLIVAFKVCFSIIKGKKREDRRLGKVEPNIRVTSCGPIIVLETFSDAETKQTYIEQKTQSFVDTVAVKKHSYFNFFLVVLNEHFVVENKHSQ